MGWQWQNLRWPHAWQAPNSLYYCLGPKKAFLFAVVLLVVFICLFDSTWPYSRVTPYSDCWITCIIVQELLLAGLEDHIWWWQLKPCQWCKTSTLPAGLFTLVQEPVFRALHAVETFQFPAPRVIPSIWPGVILEHRVEYLLPLLHVA